MRILSTSQKKSCSVPTRRWIWFSKVLWRWSHQDDCSVSDTVRPTVWISPNRNGYWKKLISMFKDSSVDCPKMFEEIWVVCDVTHSLSHLLRWRFMLQSGCNVCRKTGWIQYKLPYSPRVAWDEWHRYLLYLVLLILEWTLGNASYGINIIVASTKAMSASQNG